MHGRRRRGEVVPAIMYGISPVHTDEWFAERVREYVELGDHVTRSTVEDAAGMLARAGGDALPALVAAAGDVPIEMQCHNTIGLAPDELPHRRRGRHPDRAHRRRVRWRTGRRCRRPRTADREPALARPRHRTSTSTRGRRSATHFAPRRPGRRAPVGAPREYSVAVIDQQLPGGMTGTLRDQLVQYGMVRPLRRGARGGRPSCAPRWATRSWRRRTRSSSGSRRCSTSSPASGTRWCPTRT